jgi:hypothetical protein
MSYPIQSYRDLFTLRPRERILLITMMKYLPPGATHHINPTPRFYTVRVDGIPRSVTIEPRGEPIGQWLEKRYPGIHYSLNGSRVDIETSSVPLLYPQLPAIGGTQPATQEESAYNELIKKRQEDQMRPNPPGLVTVPIAKPAAISSLPMMEVASSPVSTTKPVIVSPSPKQTELFDAVMNTLTKYSIPAEREALAMSLSNSTLYTLRDKVPEFVKELTENRRLSKTPIREPDPEPLDDLAREIFLYMTEGSKTNVLKQLPMGYEAGLRNQSREAESAIDGRPYHNVLHNGSMPARWFCRPSMLASSCNMLATFAANKQFVHSGGPVGVFMLTEAALCMTEYEGKNIKSVDMELKALLRSDIDEFQRRVENMEKCHLVKLPTLDILGTLAGKKEITLPLAFDSNKAVVLRRVDYDGVQISTCDGKIAVTGTGAFVDGGIRAADILKYAPGNVQKPIETKFGDNLRIFVVQTPFV